MLNQPLWSDAELTAMIANKRAYLGAWGEAWLKDKLERNGYQAENAHAGEMRGDLRVIDPATGEVWRVEVKTARPDKDRGRYRFCLRKRGHTDISHADYVALLCVARWGAIDLYLAPVSAFGEAGTVSIGKSGKYEVFKTNSKTIKLGVHHGEIE